MTILILGGEGMLGHKMLQTLRKHFPNVACTLHREKANPRYANIELFQSGIIYDQLDVMDLDVLDEFLCGVQPTIVINCIGIIKQRRATNAAIPSITINSLLPHRIANTLSQWGGRLIHFSTDCVFNGKLGNYYETSPSDAEDLYGKTKYLGEVTDSHALTLRTSIIGRELSHFQSLLEWFLRQKGKTIQGYTKVIYSGVTTNYLAGLVARLLKEKPKLSGLYQVVSHPISKHDLLCQLRDAFKLDITIIPIECERSDRSMCGNKFIEATGMVTPDWPTLIDQLSSDVTPYEQWQA
jgi:dTDP-4-dehydrorhamnose reductase